MAQVTVAVSGKTSFLVLGKYAGRTKFYQAKARCSVFACSVLLFLPLFLPLFLLLFVVPFASCRASGDCLPWDLDLPASKQLLAWDRICAALPRLCRAPAPPLAL